MGHKKTPVLVGRRCSFNHNDCLPEEVLIYQGSHSDNHIDQGIYYFTARVNFLIKLASSLSLQVFTRLCL